MEAGISCLALSYLSVPYACGVLYRRILVARHTKPRQSTTLGQTAPVPELGGAMKRTVTILLALLMMSGSALALTISPKVGPLLKEA
jgi:hypothetical protein